MFIRLSWLANHLKQDKVKLKKSVKTSKKGNDCNVSQVSLDVNPVPVMYIFGVFRQFFCYFRPQKVTIDPFDPGFRGVTKGTKNQFGTVSSYFKALQSLIFGCFGRFSAIFGDFRPQKVTIGPFDPGFGGVTKVTKFDISPG